MTGRREIVFAAFVVLVLLGGVAFDLMGPEVEIPSAAEIQGERFESRAVFCPPATGGRQASTYFTFGSAGGGDTIIGSSTEAGEPQELPADQILVHHSEASEPLDVVGFGSPAAATAVTARSEPSGVGAAHCATAAATRWYFAAGSADIDRDEKILIYNPFPDEAVVTLALFAPKGEQSRTALRDVAVPAGEWRTIAINDVITKRKTLAVEVAARRGRVVAWREMATFGKGLPKGIDYDLGAPTPMGQWFFPDGAVGEGADETISILNPGQQQAVVSVILATPVETLTPPDLVEYAIPPRSQRVISIEEFAGGNKDGIASVSAIVTSVNGEPVIAERSMSLDTEDLSGQASELGATQTSPSWFLGPAARSPSVDAVAVMAPGSEDVVVDITILRVGESPLAPESLQGLEITAGSRIKVTIGEWTRDETMAVLVIADSDVVAERFSYSAGADDISSLMGQPIKMLP